MSTFICNQLISITCGITIFRNDTTCSWIIACFSANPFHLQSFSKDPHTVDPADSNAENEPVKEKKSAYGTQKQEKMKADIAKIESKISLLTSLKKSGFARVKMSVL